MHLVAAAELATVAGDEESAVKWQTAADDIQQAAHKYLFNQERQVFYRGVNVVNGQVEYDAVLDTSSVYSAFMFGLFAADSHEIKASIETVKVTFNLSEQNPGLPRYRTTITAELSQILTGTYGLFVLCEKAQYDIENGNADSAMVVLNWVKSHALTTGMMAEQLDPIDDTIVSPAPLTWTHAEYVSTLIDLIGNKGNMTTSSVFKLMLRRVSPALRERGRVIRNFAKQLGFVHFGVVDQHEDEHNPIRGFTSSITHSDSHYAVGTYEGYDIRLVDRFDILKIPGHENHHQLWTIFEVKLNAKGIPHIFFVPTGREAGEYARLYATQTHLNPLTLFWIRKIIAQNFMAGIKYWLADPLAPRRAGI